jgi:hypothetical protein
MATPRILGLPFRSGVDTQVKVRQRRLAQLNKSPDDLVVFNSATSFVRLSSAVSVDGPERQKILETNLGLSTNDISGYNLAKNMVLWGGVNIQNLPGGIGYGLNSSYGFLSDSGQGLRPLPGITSMTSTYKSNGSLKTATIQIKCFTRKQFEAIEAIYLRLGYTMVLEWGHTDYFNNDENRGSTTAYSLIDKLFVNPTDLSPETIQEKIENNKRDTSYNYDGMLARVTNFNWFLNSDLSYDITLYLVSWGDIIDSLKLNTNNNPSTTSQFRFTTENFAPELFGIQLDDPLAIPQGLINILNNKSLSTLNSLFYDMYTNLILDNLESFPEDTREIIENINKQKREIEYIPTVHNKVLEWIGKYEQFVNEYGDGADSIDNANINSFVSALNSIKNEINAITNPIEFQRYWGTSPEFIATTLLNSTEAGNTLSVLKSKIENKYTPAQGNRADTPFEDYLQLTIEEQFRINL